MVIVMLSANFTFMYYPVTLCVCVEYSTTAAIANRNGFFGCYINYKFLWGKGKMQNTDAKWQYA